LAIAGKVQKGGKKVTSVERAHAEGATDKEIHDTVLIVAAFCVYIGTSTAWRLGRRRIRKFTGQPESVWPKKAMSIRQIGSL
jgi:alkylhydroperoxidase/carboxymuconolactone decarboxylase family protein YurZ